MKIVGAPSPSPSAAQYELRAQSRHKTTLAPQCCLRCLTAAAVSALPGVHKVGGREFLVLRCTATTTHTATCRVVLHVGYQAVEGSTSFCQTTAGPLLHVAQSGRGTKEAAAMFLKPRGALLPLPKAKLFLQLPAARRTSWKSGMPSS